MHIDLRFLAPVLNNILMSLIHYFSGNNVGLANEILVWDYFINHHNRWLHITLALLLVVFVISIKLSISITVHAGPIILKFGDLSSSPQLVSLLISSFLFPPQIMLCGYLICTCIWIFPLPGRVFKKIMIRLQQIPVFTITAQQPPNDLQEPVYQYFEVIHDGDDDDNDDTAINFFFGHA
ncbi:hypothetical protein DCAR_0209407 [Daucus carota subsp. sativus]|uniref:Uncharacterized protein n=1 Tax=Daucus carota subsp. sativus TaxID=79200 RepID=A0AAF1ANY8_DAUCS|nr:hypothetical protein DCAR_0209407 [Daucus carota subsp. sativus]